MNENNHITANYQLSELTDRIIKCAQAVHKQIGNGFHEMVYKRPLAFELFIRDIPFEREMDILLNNNEEQSGKMSADFFVDGKVLVELKSTVQLDGAPLNPIINLLETHNMELGLILNFGAERLEYKIVTNTKYQNTNRKLEKERF
jgi:GxxExxY protein